MLPKNWGKPMGAPAIFEKQIEIKLLRPASTEGVTDSGNNCSTVPHAKHQHKALAIRVLIRGSLRRTPHILNSILLTLDIDQHRGHDSPADKAVLTQYGPYWC
ncbi:MAG: hypothetical protein P8X89_01785 [Reinekea sp.]